MYKVTLQSRPVSHRQTKAAPNPCSQMRTVVQRHSVAVANRSWTTTVGGQISRNDVIFVDILILGGAGQHYIIIMASNQNEISYVMNGGSSTLSLSMQWCAVLIHLYPVSFRLIAVYRYSMITDEADHG